MRAIGGIPFLSASFLFLNDCCDDLDLFGVTHLRLLVIARLLFVFLIAMGNWSGGLKMQDGEIFPRVSE